MLNLLRHAIMFWRQQLDQNGVICTGANVLEASVLAVFARFRRFDGGQT
jgi:hypothetical protein